MGSLFEDTNAQLKKNHNLVQELFLADFYVATNLLLLFEQDSALPKVYLLNKSE